MIALGTSLAEFLATVIAVLCRHGVVAVGNVLDSGRASGFRRRYSHNRLVGHAWRDGRRATAMISGWRVSRTEGAFLLGACVAYVGSLIVRGVMNI